MTTTIMEYVSKLILTCFFIGSLLPTVVNGTISYSNTKQHRSYPSFNASTSSVNDVKTIDNIRIVVVRYISMPGTATFTVTGGGISTNSAGTYVLSASGTVTITFTSPAQGAANTDIYSGYSVYAFDVDDIDANRPEVQTSAPSTLDKTLIANVDTVSKLYLPNFPSNFHTSSQDHYWLIKSPCQSYLLHIDLNFLDVRCNDRFYVYDGNTTSGVNWGFTSCKNNPPSDTSESKTSPGGSQYALVRLDGNGVGGFGFWLEYYVNTGDYTTALSSYNTATTNTVCSSNETLMAYCPFGEENKLILQMIETDNNYQPSRSCQWTIIGDDYTHIVQIDFDYLEVGNDTLCSLDSVKIYDDESVREDRLLNTLCGAAPAQSSIYSSGQFLTLVFKTDDSLEFRGFRLKYKSLNVTTTTDYRTSCLGHITPAVVEYAATSTDIELISHPGYDGLTSTYQNNYDMYWLIKNPSAAYASSSLIINITDIQIEKSTDCRNDRIIIYNGPCTNGENAIVDQHCGCPKYSIYPSVQYRLVRFHTDWSRVYFGFKFSFRVEGSSSYTAEEQDSGFAPGHHCFNSAADECIANAVCNLDEQSCSGFSCVCTEDYYSSSGACLNRKPAGSDCDGADSDQCVSNAQCIADINSGSRFTCVCITGYNNNSGACTLQRGSGEPCSGIGEDECFSHAYCLADDSSTSGYSCQCPEEFYTRNGSCFARVTILGECSPFLPIECVSNAECLEDGENMFSCYCTSGYYATRNACFKRLPPGSSCITGLVQCVANAICSADPRSVTGYSCECEENYYVNKGACIIDRRLWYIVIGISCGVLFIAIIIIVLLGIVIRSKRPKGPKDKIQPKDNLGLRNQPVPLEYEDIEDTENIAQSRTENSVRDTSSVSYAINATDERSNQDGTDYEAVRDNTLGRRNADHEAQAETCFTNQYKVLVCGHLDEGNGYDAIPLSSDMRYDTAATTVTALQDVVQSETSSQREFHVVNGSEPSFTQRKNADIVDNPQLPGAPSE